MGNSKPSKTGKRPRRSRLEPSQDDSAKDLGPFEAALQQRSQQQPEQAVDEAMDLGPFEAVLSGTKAADVDLGPFEAVLGGRPVVAEDLGPFEAVLPASQRVSLAAD